MDNKPNRERLFKAEDEEQFLRKDTEIKLKRETRFSDQNFGELEGGMKNDMSNSMSANSGCPNVSKLSYENKKRNKYRMLGTDLKRKAVHLVSFMVLTV
jgi:ribosomal protein S8E